MAITRAQALDFFHSDDLIGLGMEADAVRRRLHPEGVVTYLIDRSISCTNAESVTGNAASPLPCDLETICGKIAETLEMGGTGVLLSGVLLPGVPLQECVPPDMPLAPGITWFEDLFSGVKQRFPQVWLQCFSAPEILTLARLSSIPMHDTIARLRDAGLDSISGDGTEFLEGGSLTDGSHCTLEDWLAVHRTAHRLGMQTPAAMIFGSGESFEDRVSYLDQLRRLQEETGGFTAFVPRNFRPRRTPGGPDEATAVECLKTLAISRLYLDNIENIQSSWTTQGLKVLQMGLRFGGNDAGSVTPQEAAAPGAPKSTTEEELRRIIRDAGFRPVQRDTSYRTMFLN